MGASFTFFQGASTEPQSASWFLVPPIGPSLANLESTKSLVGALRLFAQISGALQEPSSWTTSGQLLNEHDRANFAQLLAGASGIRRLSGHPPGFGQNYDVTASVFDVTRALGDINIHACGVYI